MGVHWIPFPLDFTIFKFETLLFRVRTLSDEECVDMGWRGRFRGLCREVLVRDHGLTLCSHMPEVDNAKLRECIHEYLASTSDLQYNHGGSLSSSNVNLKSMRKYCEKKLGLPKKTLDAMKTSFMSMITVGFGSGH